MKAERMPCFLYPDIESLIRKKEKMDVQITQKNLQ